MNVDFDDVIIADKDHGVAVAREEFLEVLLNEGFLSFLWLS